MTPTNPQDGVGLKPCPCCSSDRIIPPPDHWLDGCVYCRDCGLRGISPTAWNLRPAQPIADAGSTSGEAMREAAAVELDSRVERARVAAIGGGMDPLDASLLDYEYSNAADAIRKLPVAIPPEPASDTVEHIREIAEMNADMPNAFSTQIDRAAAIELAVTVALATLRTAPSEWAGDDRDCLVQALEEIVQWAGAYPLNIFPEPNFEVCAAALKSVGQTLDAVSASNMRHVVDGVGKIARAALTARQAPDTGEG